MNLDFLYYFERLAELENYNKTAEDLFISQPSLSYAIKSLEKELGFNLFKKRGRCTELTSNGKVYLEYVQIALSHLEQAKKVINSTNMCNECQLKLRLAVSRVFFIKDILSSFYKKCGNKKVTVFIHQSSSENNVRDLISGNIDGMFSAYKIHEDLIEYIPIVKQQWFIFVPLTHSLSLLDSISLNTIEKYPLIVPKKDPEQMKAINEICSKHSFNPNIYFETITNASAIRMVINYNLPGLIHYFPDSDNSPVNRIRIQERLDGFYTYFACLKRRRDTDPINYFREFINNLYKDDVLYIYPPSSYP